MFTTMAKKLVELGPDIAPDETNLIDRLKLRLTMCYFVVSGSFRYVKATKKCTDYYGVNMCTGKRNELIRFVWKFLCIDEHNC